MSREPALAPKERSDTSIARQGYDQGPTPMPRSERPSDHRPHIPRRPLSTGLSDLMIMPFWFHSPALHSPALRFGLCWYHVGLSALAHGIGKLAPKERPDTSVARQGYDLDTSIVRQGYDHRDTAPKGLKDRRIFARPNIRPLSTGLSDLMIMPFWFHSLPLHSPALRFGLCWYRVGLSALAHGIGKLAPKVRPDTSVARQGYDPDTSIARQGYDLKDRRIIAAAQADLIQRLFRPH